MLRHISPFCIKGYIFFLMLSQSHLLNPNPSHNYRHKNEEEQSSKENVQKSPKDSSTSRQSYNGLSGITATKTHKAVKAWTSSANHSPPTGILGDISSIYGAAMIIKLVKTYHDRVTTNDHNNEAYYTLKRLGDNVWYNIERVVPFKTFIHWAINTSRITDRYDSSGRSQINRYIQNESSGCAPESAFDIPYNTIMSDDANKRIRLDPEIDRWFEKNEDTPTEKLCNRFRGLRCNPSEERCECDSPDAQYQAYHKTEEPGKYRDGCYIKPWRTCTHLSLDTRIPSEYKSYHAHHHNMKQFLFRMATPMPKTLRCEKGTYCVDMILNLKRPICWCSSRSHSKECFKINGSLPLLSQFLEVRKHFHLMMIPEQDRTTQCLLDAKLDDYLQDLQALIEDVPRNYINIFKLMKQILEKKGKNGRFCDFRKGLACDPYKKTCTYKSGCGPGRVMEMSNGRKTCLVNNGYPCPTIELQCVRGAECKDFGQGKHCHCASDRYGDLCKFKNPTFFGTLLQSRVCGFVGYHFINLQELVNNVLAPVERLMTLGYGETCDARLDTHAMSIVRQLGTVRTVTLGLMEGALADVQYLVEQDQPLCDYRKFLGCGSGICEPLIPDVDKYELKSFPRLPGKVRVLLSMRHGSKCGGTGNSSMIAIFQDIVRIQCLPQHVCRKADGRSSSNEKNCLCPVGFEGARCEVRTPRTTRIDIYERPVRGISRKEDNEDHDKIIDIHGIM